MSSKDCKEYCEGTSGPYHPDPNGGSNGQTGTSACTTLPDGTSYYAVEKNFACNPFQLSKSRDSRFIDGVVGESLNIGGADFNVYKLLGVHEQGKLIDVTGNGNPLSNGDAPGFPASNAFDVFITEWRSIQRGDGVTASAFLGYDFGEIKVDDGSRRRYGIEASVRKHITALAIKQSANPLKRVTRARIERSADGRKWYGVAVVNLPDDDCLNTILFGDSILMRYWRIRPLSFNGGNTDYWGVQALQMFHNYAGTRHDNIQDKIYLENRDRDYADEPLLLKGSYDLLDVSSELMKLGIELPAQTFYMTTNFSQCVAALGRPLVIGDIIEIPSEAQYSADMRRIEKWMEVTDVAWSTEGYTPGWQPTLLRVILQPAYVSQETQDIFGDLAENEIEGEWGLLDKGDGKHPIFQDYSDVDQHIAELSYEISPEQGSEGSSTIRAWEQSELDTAKDQGLPNLQKIGQHPTGLYVEDAMPPNDHPFTEGPEYPSSPSHGDYHRLTYEGLSRDVPARLYRFSTSKNRWIYLETDRRAEFNPDKPRLEEFLKTSTSKPHTHITRDKKDEI
jgi:hypothetical protein